MSESPEVEVPLIEQLSPRSWLIISAVLALLACLAFYAYQYFVSAAIMNSNVANARQICLALRAYAHDSEGEWPDTLSELYPDYLDAGENTLEVFRFYHPKKRQGLDWVYLKPAASDPPTDLIVLRSPASWRDLTIVGYPSGLVHLASAKTRAIP